MKMRVRILLLSCLVLASVAEARSSRAYFPKSRSRPIQAVGEVRCDEGAHDAAHARQHDCSFTFVNAANGDTWSVSNPEVFLKAHRALEAPIRAKIEGSTSPPSLFGGSVRVTRWSTIEN